MKTKYLVALLSTLICAVAFAETVELTDLQGRTISARLLNLEGEDLTIVREDGRQFRISLGQLSVESRMLARKRLGSTIWTQYFPNGLVNTAGEEVSPWVLEGKMVALYFGASWCSPCKPVEDRLQAFRDEVGDHLEVVFISQDRSEDDQMRYMVTSGMPWPAVKWANPHANDRNEVQRLLQEHQAWGIPTVVILSQQGQVVDADARMKIELLPEENVASLENYDYDRALEMRREAEKGQGNQLTPAEEAEFLRRTRSLIERRIAEFAELKRETDRHQAIKTPVTWPQLLGAFYKAQRMAARQSLATETSRRP